ncbi:mechanosensitive ion channel family protein [Arcticibacter eurypsychrophilus]|uniref:mechanosensitive ion channel family protein n=1 Tax=Arcticibacter eurypsychrophilus TaxID=1434752 RepID=UPI001FDEB498|nr:mechanosensitive ion channel family protein [Arcticibacter eurypsychrophilus]
MLLNDTAEKVKQEPSWPNDTLGRRTPRGTVEGFIKAVSQEDYAKASLYLSIDSTLRRKQDRVLQAQGLQQLLDQKGNIFPYSMISDNEEGQQGDNLGENLDHIGDARVNKEKFEILLENTKGSDGGPIWLFSIQTIQRIPLQLDSVSSAPLLSKLAPKVLEENKWGGVPLAHWMAMLLIIIVAYLLALGITKTAIILIPLFWHKARTEPISGIITAFALPIRLYLAVWLFVIGGRQAGISIIVRHRFSDITVVVLLVAVLLLIWQLVDFISRYAERRLARHGNQAGVSAVLFLRRAAKIALVIMCVIMILSTFGFDVTTGLAALGIGGIALALGAQKTVENFVGSVTLIADQPVRVGDFCKVGDVVGTVEQIGMRSTRIRTLNRTIVTIPNGEFSSNMIENYAHRDRFWFHPTFGLRFETTPDQIRYLLVELRSILYAHPKVDPSPARVRFVEIGADSLKLEVFAYVHAVNFDQFLEIQEDLYLRMMDIITESGTGFAFPSQTLYLAKDHAPSLEKAEEIHETVKKWREAGDMSIPTFNPDYIDDLKNTIPYPPEGSSVYKNDNSFKAVKN